MSKKNKRRKNNKQSKKKRITQKIYIKHRKK